MMTIGQGIDFHRFKDGRRMVLGGVEFPGSCGLDGHSDADVLIHALMDALLGAAGLGDIGRLFPDSDQTFLNIDSTILLDRVMTELEERGYHVVNADITVIGQKPRISEKRTQIEDKLKAFLATERVNVKATTTETMGALGREEGLAAAAVVLLENGTL